MSFRSTSADRPLNTTKVFEGADLGVLLEQVRVEYGDRATVVAANRCRSGGIAGFFATESFEVIVEIPTPAPAPATAAPRRTRLTARAAARATATAAPVKQPTSPTRSSSPALDALIDAADEAERNVASPNASTGSSAGAEPFDAVLRRAAADPMSPAAGPTPSPITPTKRRLRSAAPARTQSRGLLRRRRPENDRVIDLAALERAGLMPTLNPAPSIPSSIAPLRRGTDVSTNALLQLGVPSSLLASAEHGRISLASVIGRLPVPPPMITGHGATIAFVGEAAIVLGVARAVSVALHQDPDACVLLSPGPRPVGFTGEQISVIDDLSHRREEWSGLDRLTVVAIDIGFARQDVAWGRHAVSMLRPAMRWGVVAATRKADDIRAWSRGIGGLHALAVTGITDTTSPASVLSSGVPVARIDGQVATPELWMRLLGDRLAEQTSRRAPDLIAT
jgi:hypothetical protein